MILVCGMGWDSVELAAAVVLIVLMEVSFGAQDLSQLWGGSSAVTDLRGT